MDCTREGKLSLFQKAALKKKKTYYAKLIATSQSGVARLELYEDEKHSLTEQPSLMVVGSDVVKVGRVTLTPKEMRNAFMISTRDHHYTFFVETSLDCDRWVKDIQVTLIAETHVSSSPRDKKSISEVNEIYEPADKFFPQTQDFIVTINEKTRGRMGVDGKVRLVVENDSIAIITTSGKMIVRWSLKNLRKFSYQATTFEVEAGRMSSLGAGTFTFLTDEGEKISSVIDMRKRALKQKLETTHHTGAVSLPVQGHHSAPKPRSCVPLPVHGNSHSSYLENTSLYDTLENVMHPSNTNSSRVHADNKVTPMENKAESLPRPVSPCSPSKNSKPSITSQCISSSVRQHATKVAAKDVALHPGQAEIYSEPQEITDAWKSYAYSDSDDGAIYSNLTISQSETLQGVTRETSKPTEKASETLPCEVRSRPGTQPPVTPRETVIQEMEEHYWRGTDVKPRVDAKQEKEERVQADDIYAEIDFSKKSKNRK